MSEKVLVAGVGMIPFSKPGASPSYTDMGAQALCLALQDAGLGYERVQQAYVGYVYGVNLALQHNLGLGGACVVTLYGKH